MNPHDFKPVYVWEDNSPVRNCRVLVNSKGKRSTIVIQFLGKILTSRHGLDYVSWAINDLTYETIKTIRNPRTHIMLELEPKEDWNDVEDAGRLLSREQFLTLVAEYARPFPGRDYRTFGEADLRLYHDHPNGNPNKQIWR